MFENRISNLLISVSYVLTQKMTAASFLTTVEDYFSSLGITVTKRKYLHHLSFLKEKRIK